MVWRVLRAALVQNRTGQGLCAGIDVADKDYELPLKEWFKSCQFGTQCFYNELKADQILDQPKISLPLAVVL